jgi:hypothetical protein
MSLKIILSSVILNVFSYKIRTIWSIIDPIFFHRRRLYYCLEQQYCSGKKYHKFIIIMQFAILTIQKQLSDTKLWEIRKLKMLAAL